MIQRPSGTNQRGVLGNGNERRGGYVAATAVMPPHERFRADDRARHVDLRLIDEREFVAFERHANVVFERPPGGRIRLHARVEEAYRVASGSFGLVHGEVRFLEELVGRVARLEHRDADARRAVELVRIEHEGHVERREDIGGNCIRMRRRLAERGAQGIEHDDEFVAAEARHGIARTNGALEPKCYLLQQFVAFIVTQRVVERFEIVEVDEE